MALEVSNTVPLVGFILFFLASLYFIYRFKVVEDGLGEFSTGIQYRDFYGLLTVMVPMMAAATYLFVSLGLGTMTVGGREVVWLRYFEWSLTTPLLIIGVVILTQSTSLTSSMMVLDFVMILSGFVASVTQGTLKHISFAISTLLFIFLLYLLLRKATDAAEKRTGRARHLFTRLRNLIVVVWLIYPVVWIMSTDGYALISYSLSNLLFLGLDVVAKIGFAYIVLHSFGELDMIDVDPEFWDE